MAIPDSNTFSMTDVLTELQITGTSSTVRNLEYIISDAPNISYDPTYAGSKNSLLNFRNYKLFLELTGMISAVDEVAYDGTNVWATNRVSNAVTKVTPSGVMTEYTGLGDTPYSIAFDGTNMWTGNQSHSVTKITPAGSMTKYDTGSGINYGIAFDGTNMWVAGTGVKKIAPDGTYTSYTGLTSTGIAFDGTNMWTANPNNDGVTKITPAGSMTTYNGTGDGPWGIAFDGTNMWTQNYYGHNITKITPAGSMTTYSDVMLNNGTAQRIAFDGTNMWVALNGILRNIVKILPDGSFRKYINPASAVPTGKITFGGGFIWIPSVVNSIGKFGVV
jgi:hypothetical protein